MSYNCYNSTYDALMYSAMEVTDNLHVFHIHLIHTLLCTSVSVTYLLKTLNSLFDKLIMPIRQT